MHPLSSRTSSSAPAASSHATTSGKPASESKAARDQAELVLSIHSGCILSSLGLRSGFDQPSLGLHFSPRFLQQQAMP